MAQTSQPSIPAASAGPGFGNFSGANNSVAQAAFQPPAFFYAPSFDLALAGSAVVSALAVIHTYLIIKTRAWNFQIMPQAALLFAIGMIMRLVVISVPRAELPLKISQTALGIPSSIMTIQLIFTYTRLIWWITPWEHRNFNTLWLPPRANSFILALLSTAGDVLGTIGTGQTVIKSPGIRTVAIGAVLQLLVRMLFAVLVARFVFISRRWELHPFHRCGSLELGLALTASAFLLVIRGVMAVLEKDALQNLVTTRRPSSIVTTSEWPTWVFNFAPLVLVLIIMAQWHPGFYIPHRLMGFRLNSKGLLKDEEDKRLLIPGATRLSNGMCISKPIPDLNDIKMMRILKEKEKEDYHKSGIVTMYAEVDPQGRQGFPDVNMPIRQQTYQREQSTGTIRYLPFGHPSLSVR